MQQQDFVARLGDRYRFVRALGRGGHGDVSLVWDRLLGREVAIKRLHRTPADEQAIGGLLHEAKLAAQVIHPNVTTLYDVVMLGTTPALVMEYVEGRSLKLAAVDGQWSLAERVAILLQVCDGLTAVHARGIAHGDVRPENVMVTADLQAKILDFGIGALKSQTAMADTTGGKPSAQIVQLSDEQGLVALVQYAIPSQYRSPFCKAVMSQLTSCRSVTEIRAALVSLHDHTSQEETQAANVSHSKSGLLGVRWMTGLFATLIAFFALALIVFKPTQAMSRGVVVQRAELSGSETLSATQLQSISDQVQFAIETTVYRNSSLYLFRDFVAPVNEEGSQPNTWKITPYVTCDHSRCSLRIEAAGQDGRERQVSRNVPFAPDSASTVFSVIPNLMAEMGVGEVSDDNLPAIQETDLLLFEQLYRQAHYDGASCEQLLPEIDQLKLRSPDFPLAHHLAVYCALEMYYASGDQAHVDRESADLLEFVFSHPAASPGNYEPIIKSYAETGDFSAARRALASAQQAGADWWTLTLWEADLLSYEGRYAEADSKYRAVIEIAPSHKAMFNAAHNAYYWGDTERAISLAEQTLRLFEREPSTLNFLGMVHLGVGNMSNAVAMLEEATQLKDVGYFKSNLALAYLISGSWEKAASLHASLVGDDLITPQIALNYGDSLSALGSANRAREWYERALVDTAQAASLPLRLIRAQALSHLGRFAEAIESIDKARDTFGESSELFYAAAVVHTLAGDEELAALSATRAIRQGIHISWFAFPWFKPLCDRLGAEGGGAVRMGCSEA